MLWGGGHLRACVHEPDTWEYHVGLLDYYLLNNCVSANLLYCPMNLGHEACTQEHTTEYTDPNMLAWQNAVGNGIAIADIRLVVYELDAVFIEDYLKSAEKYTLNTEAIVQSDKPNTGKVEKKFTVDSFLKLSVAQAMKKSPFINFLVSNGRTDILEYLLYAKSCEPFAMQEDYAWEEKNQKFDKKAMNKLITEGEAKMQAKGIPFWVKQRYLYQIVRMACLMRANKRAIELYDAYIGPFEGQAEFNNYLYSRTLGRKAGALYREKQFANSRYCYGKIFHTSYSYDPDFAMQAYRNFRFIQRQIEDDKLDAKALWEESLKLATKEEKASLWLLGNFSKARNNYDRYVWTDNQILDQFTYNFPSLKGAYEGDPDAWTTELILLREIQKIETNIYRPLLYTRPAVDKSRYQPPKPELQKVAKKIHRPGFFARMWEGMGNFFGGIWRWIRSWFVSEQSIQPKDDEVVTVADAWISVSGSFAFHYLDKDQPINIEYLDDMADFLAEVDKSKVLQPALWYMMEGYVQIMQRRLEEVVAQKRASGFDNLEMYNPDITRNTNPSQLLTEAIRSIDAKEGQNPNIKLQAELLQAFVELEEAQNQADFEAVASSFWEGHTTKTPHFDQVYFNLLGQKYLAEGELGKAAMALKHAGSMEAVAVVLDMYTTDEELENLIAFMQDGGTEKIDDQLIKAFYKVDDIQEVRATRLARENQFEEALEVLEEIPKRHWDAAFSFRIRYGSQSEPSEKEASPHNRLSFFREVVAAQAEAEKEEKEKAVDMYMQLGNALYSTAFWGYNCNLWEYNLINTARSFEGNEYPLNVSDSLATQLYVSKRVFLEKYGTGWAASQYYQKVMELDKDQKGATACYLAMLALNKPLTSFHEGYKIDIQPYFQEFQTTYGNVPFAQYMIEDCPTLKEYL